MAEGKRVERPWKRTASCRSDRLRDRHGRQGSRSSIATPHQAPLARCTVAPASAPRRARTRAVLVAILAAFLALATFLSNEAVKEVITGETKAADASARLEANDVKTTVAENDATLLKVLARRQPGGAPRRAASRPPPWRSASSRTTGRSTRAARAPDRRAASTSATTRTSATCSSSLGGRVADRDRARLDLDHRPPAVAARRRRRAGRGGGRGARGRPARLSA